MTKRVLGRGLEALLSVQEAEPGSGGATSVTEIPIEKILPNEQQPRRRFDPDKIAELAESIEAKGILQPIVVRPMGKRFQIIAGERRFLAAQQAGLREVPVVVREVPDDEMLEWALIENLQRDNLDPVEEAEAFRVLIEDKGLTHDQLSRFVGRDRTSITNSIRLLKLSESMLRALAEGRISSGHGRALLQVADPGNRDRLFERVLRQQLSVRQAEELARGGKTKRPRGKKSGAKPAVARDPQVADFEDRLRMRLGTRVQIRQGDKGGTIEIEWYSLEEFDRIYAELMSGSDAESAAS